MTLSLGTVATAVLLGHDPNTTWMAICFSYFDASGSSKDPACGTVTVAGFIATETHWKRFEHSWNAALRAEDVSSFSMKHFAHFKKDFAKGWQGNEPRRVAFLTKLAQITKRHVRRSFCRSVDLEEYRYVDTKYALSEHGPGPYAICAATLMSVFKT
jgi:predicted transposase YbfD/YdcC